MQIYMCVRKRSILLCVLFSIVAAFASKQREHSFRTLTPLMQLFIIYWWTPLSLLWNKRFSRGDGKCGGAAGAFLDTFLLTVCQCDGAFLRIDREQATLVANVSLRDEADLRAKLRHSRTHCNSSYYLALRYA